MFVRLNFVCVNFVFVFYLSFRNLILCHILNYVSIFNFMSCYFPYLELFCAWMSSRVNRRLFYLNYFCWLFRIYFMSYFISVHS